MNHSAQESLTHVEDTAWLDDEQLGTSLVDTCQYSADTIWANGRVEGVGSDEES